MAAGPKLVEVVLRLGMQCPLEADRHENGFSPGASRNEFGPADTLL